MAKAESVDVNRAVNTKIERIKENVARSARTDDGWTPVEYAQIKKEFQEFLNPTDKSQAPADCHKQWIQGWIGSNYPYLGPLYEAVAKGTGPNSAEIPSFETFKGPRVLKYDADQQYSELDKKYLKLLMDAGVPIDLRKAKDGSDSKKEVVGANKIDEIVRAVGEKNLPEFAEKVMFADTGLWFNLDEKGVIRLARHLADSAEGEKLLKQLPDRPTLNFLRKEAEMWKEAKQLKSVEAVLSFQKKHGVGIVPAEKIDAYAKELVKLAESEPAKALERMTHLHQLLYDRKLEFDVPTDDFFISHAHRLVNPALNKLKESKDLSPEQKGEIILWPLPRK
jgi:hypothetical protein